MLNFFSSIFYFFPRVKPPEICTSSLRKKRKYIFSWPRGLELSQGHGNARFLAALVFRHCVYNVGRRKSRVPVSLTSNAR